MKLALSKVLNKLRESDYRYYITVALVLFSILLGAFVYFNSYIRLYETFIDFCGAVVYYFKFLFTGGNVEADLTILNGSNVTYPLEIAFEEFKALIVNFYYKFIELENFKSFVSTLFKVLFFVCAFSGIVIVFFYVIYKIFILTFYQTNNKNIYEPSIPLKVYLYLIKKIYSPCKKWIIDYKNFLLSTRKYLKILLVIWVFNLNIPSIVLASIGYLLFFAVSYRVGTIFFQIYKLIMDLSLMFGGLPFVFWAVIAFVLFHLWRKKLALRRLQGMEESNRGFLESLPISNFVVGPMGAKKTTVITDMCLSMRNIFRDKAFAIIREHELRFPDYPWLDYVRRLCEAIENEEVKSLADIDVFSAKEYKLAIFRYKFAKHIERHNRKHPDRLAFDIVKYDFGNYSYEFDTGLDICTLEQSMNSYAKAFFVYICPNYNFANYSIRFDDILQTNGNFPLWDYDFHNRKSDEIDLISRYAKILNFDWLRLGTKIVMSNKELFEFGILAIGEIAKERGNQKDHDLLKKTLRNSLIEEANPLTDNFNDSIKVIRHPSTIDFFPFAKMFCDDQRADSLGADLRELGNIITIEETSEKSLSLVLFGIEDKICNFILTKYTDIFYKYSFYRADRCLREKILKDFASLLYAYQLRIYNKYGFVKLRLAVENGKRDGPVDYVDYYLSFKKIYSRRFSTDCYSEFYNELLRECKRGIYQFEEYAGVRMTFEEISKQNSYFGRKLSKHFGKKE